MDDITSLISCMLAFPINGPSHQIINNMIYRFSTVAHNSSTYIFIIIKVILTSFMSSINVKQYVNTQQPVKSKLRGMDVIVCQ